VDDSPKIPFERDIHSVYACTCRPHDDSININYSLVKTIGRSLIPTLEILLDDERPSPDQPINAAMALCEYSGEALQRLTRLMTRASAR